MPDGSLSSQSEADDLCFVHEADLVALQDERDRYKDALESVWGEAYLGCLEGHSADVACSNVIRECMNALGPFETGRLLEKKRAKS